jgi:hypothetical protein
MKTIQLRKQSGSSLVVVLSVLATLMVVVAVAAEYTNTVNRHVQRSNTVQNAIAVGDSCIEILFAHWRKICSAPGSVLNGQPTSAFNSIPTPSPGQLNLPNVTNFVKRGTIINPLADEGPSPIPSDYDPNYTISNYKIIAVGPNWEALPDVNTAPVPMLGQIAATITSTSNTTPLVYNYIASADVTLPALGPTGKVVAKVRRVIQKQQISPWSFAIFYVDPLEIHPGPDFTVTGWVHTNSDLYTAHPSLTFADKVTYASDWFVGFKPGDRQHDTDIPGPPHYPSDLPPARDQALQPFGLDSTSLFNTTDTNPNNDSYRELIEPPTSATDPLASMRYWDQASVAIKIDNSNTITVGRPNADGTLTSFATLIAANPAGSALRAKYQALSDMFSTTGATPAIVADGTTIQDTREGLTNPGHSSIRVATLDVSRILNNTSGLNPTYKANDVATANGVAPYFNGIVYIYDNSATAGLNADGTVNTAAVKRGIRLKGGSKIPSTVASSSQGFTLASNNPVFIQGDFNTGGTGPAVPSNVDGSYSNPATPPNPQVAGYTRAPCSILADAVTITSQNWGGVSGVVNSDNTTVNAAIVSGIVPTSPVGGDGAYSGGAENFPRFLENWNGTMFTYYGSMVELFKSNQSVGKWTGDISVYRPPDRRWYFDTNFKIKPPPGSLMIHSYIKGKWTVL